VYHKVRFLINIVKIQGSTIPLPPAELDLPYPVVPMTYSGSLGGVDNPTLTGTVQQMVATVLKVHPDLNLNITSEATVSPPRGSGLKERSKVLHSSTT
jgi:hypothetical protein